jgi:hypothetical protein
MPYKSEKIIIEGTNFDRRVKLDDYQKACIIEERKHSGLSYQKLANKYNVSKKLVMLICNPDLMAKNKAQFKERRKDGRYYDSEKNTIATREHRKYKHELFQKDLI